MDVIDTDQRSSLLQYGNNDDCKEFYSTDPKVCGLYYKCVTIVIYDRNDSRQYYKTNIIYYRR
jgi:hypothetical protein